MPLIAVSFVPTRVFIAETVPSTPSIRVPMPVIAVSFVPTRVFIAETVPSTPSIRVPMPVIAVSLAPTRVFIAETVPSTPSMRVPIPVIAVSAVPTRVLVSFNCLPVTASVEVVLRFASATLVMRFSKFTRPTETVLATSASELLPIAVAPTAVAWLLLPKTLLLSELAVLL